MKTVLIGYTGFVGSNLLSQSKYDVLINSKNFESLINGTFDKIVCAGVSSVKWKANKNPEEDLMNINKLVDVLKTVKANKFILISTVDVYNVLSNADESTICSNDNHAYGRHRLYFENFCKEQFKDILIVRLPALFGQGLKKNVIYDLLNDNCLEMINLNSSFQYYCLNNLTHDINLAEIHGIKLINLFTEPITTLEIVNRFFKDKLDKCKGTNEVHYNLYTKYAELNNHNGKYLYTKDEIFKQLTNFITGYKR